MRLTGVKAVVLAGLIALATATPAKAWWWGGRWGGWGGWASYNLYWPYYGYYGYSPVYSSYYGYYPYYNYTYPYYTYSTLYPASYATVPAYTAPDTVAALPVTGTYQSFYPPATAAVATPNPNEAVVNVYAAPDAQLWFDGVAMSQKGPLRTFATPDLRPGENYHYNVRVRWMDNGSPVERTRTVNVAAGQTVNVDLTPSALK